MAYLEPNYHHFHQPHHDQFPGELQSYDHNSHIYLNTMTQHSAGLIGLPTTKINETKPRLGKEEVEILEREFKKNTKPTTQTKKQYADDMDVELARINNWFQNRRAKRKQEKKQEAYEFQQSQEAAGFSEPSSPDFFNANFGGDTHFMPLQHANTFPMMNGPPQPAAPCNPQYSDPTTASMKSLQRTMAAAQASFSPHRQEFHNYQQRLSDGVPRFGGSTQTDSDQAQFPPVDGAYAQFNGQRSFSYASSSATQQALNTFPSQLLPEAGHDGLPRNVFDSCENTIPDGSIMSTQAIGFKFDNVDSNESSPPAPSVPFKAPPPMDIASRRKKVAVRPAALTADTIRGRPPVGSRTVSQVDNLRRSSDSPMGSPMRRVMSAGGIRNVMSGRINKGGIESAQRSPINLGGFSDAGAFMEHSYHTIRQPPTAIDRSTLNSSLAPPTPMSPRGGEIGSRQQDGGTSVESPAHGGLNFIFNEGVPGFYPQSETDQNLASPPETPQAQLALNSATHNDWAPHDAFQNKQWAFEVPDEPLYTPAQDTFQLEMQMPQPSYLKSMSQPVTPAFGQNFNPNYMFGVQEEQYYKHESSQYTLPSHLEHAFPDNTQYGRLSASPMTKQKTFQFSNQTPADFTEKK
ncbi:hypothetical protein BJ878DRAFT_549257 [Calycina marina]|uniref:Homeobox domain-containing protein n=1 Tax=Calycina marina TaxID=1763456 RepID=A0A9P8CKA2_9HELO|nr:hypothetical protein BJ878DRAFT_549257 [Calycina marina]